MIKVLVVDDDKLVRKGLISAMPWQEFDMQVVGEANNGERALEFLQAHPVDLLLTDLAMPVMSGLELMKKVRSQFPQIHIVVLTLHQDFEYVQEALRMGAIDYIAKVQLEKERFEEVLERISNRIIQVNQQSAAPKSPQQEQGYHTSDQAYALLALNNDQDGSWIRQWNERVQAALAEVDLNIWLGRLSAEQVKHSAQIRFPRGWALIELNGLSGLEHQEVHRWLREYRERGFFYDYDPNRAVSSLTVRSNDRPQQVHAEDNLIVLKNQWSSHLWIHNEVLFNSLLQQLKQLRLPQAKLIGLLYWLADEWNRLFYPISKESIELQASFECWLEVELWLVSVRDSVRRALSRPSFSQEVIDCVTKAIQIMHAELAHQVTSADIAKRVNMSRSYFSSCFRDIAGKTFNDFMRQARIEKAKEYLLYTNKTILWIAENTGYMDEKYFSRTFREQTGLLPSEYRQTNREGRVVSDK
jgi:two-component system response regulator YesN